MAFGLNRGNSSIDQSNNGTNYTRSTFRYVRIANWRLAEHTPHRPSP